MTLFVPIFSEVMGHGASLPPTQLLKILTRGKTSRVSAEALLQFFNPLKAWLEQQNRNDVVGWNSNMDDVALFKPFTSSARPTTVFHSFWIITMFGCFYSF